MKEELKYLITNDTIVVVVEGELKSFLKSIDESRFESLTNLLKEKKWNEVIEFFAPIVLINRQLENTAFKVVKKDGRVYVAENNEELPKLLGEKVYQFFTNGQKDYLPLIAFWNRCKTNPNTKSVEMLFEFLTKNHFPITDDGCFIAYKKVTTVKETLMDSHSKTIRNNVGDRPSMKREDVTFNPNQTCSAGLHVGAWEYVSSFSGDVTVAVKVDPFNVVSVPSDYNAQKMRVCEYEVLSVIKNGKPFEEQVIVTTPEKHDVAPKTEAVPYSVNMALTAKQIVELVKNKFGIVMTDNLKNKSAIVKKAQRIFDSNGEV